MGYLIYWQTNWWLWALTNIFQGMLEFWKVHCFSVALLNLRWSNILFISRIEFQWKIYILTMWTLRQLSDKIRNYMGWGMWEESGWRPLWVITEGQKSVLVSEHIFGCSVSGFKSWLCYIAAVWLWANHLDLLVLQFPHL